MSRPIIAIVGRPNVGKSTLFNRIIGERRSIIEETPGVTRDRMYGEAEWRGRAFSLIDTGGIEPASGDVLPSLMREQAQIAIDEADVIVLLCDVRTGLTADDRDIALMLQRSGKPVVPCVNKCDAAGDLPSEFYEFYELGFGRDPVAVSSTHGTGAGDLLDACLEALPPNGGTAEEADGGIRVAVIGKPNVGKSSLVNRLLGENRMIVSDIAGTTRDAVDSRLVRGDDVYTLIDTAGLRRGARVDSRIERYGALRAHLAVEKADVCLLLIDASEGITAQDERIAGIAHNAGRAVIIVVNKWDLIEKDSRTAGAFTDRIRQALAYMPYAPIAFVSVRTGQRVDGLFALIRAAYAEANRRVTTGALNDVLTEAILRVQPPSDKGRRLKIYYITQTGVAPPTFVLFCNSADLFHFSYRNYLENRLRETYGFKGTPVRLIIRERGENPDAPALRTDRDRADAQGGGHVL